MRVRVRALERSLSGDERPRALASSSLNVGGVNAHRRQPRAPQAAQAAVTTVLQGMGWRGFARSHGMEGEPSIPGAERVGWVGT